MKQQVNDLDANIDSPEFEHFMKLQMGLSSYLISPSGNAITCTRCGHTSFNPNDVKNKYCGHCQTFHNDLKIAV